MTCDFQVSCYSAIYAVTYVPLSVCLSVSLSETTERLAVA